MKRVVSLMASVAAVATLASCGSGSSGQGSASCADLVKFEGRSYVGSGAPPNQVAALTVGDTLGTARRPACDDRGSQNGVVVEADTGNAYAIAGVDPRWAIAYGKGADRTVLYVHNGPLPKDVQTALTVGQ